MVGVAGASEMPWVRFCFSIEKTKRLNSYKTVFENIFLLLNLM